MSKKKIDPSFSNDSQPIQQQPMPQVPIQPQPPIDQYPQYMPIQQPMPQVPIQPQPPIDQYPQYMPIQQPMPQVPIQQQPMPQVPIQPPQDPHPPQYGETINPQKLTTENALPKKIAAQEYVRNLKNIKALGIITIASPLIIMVFTTYNMVAGGVVSLIQVAIGAYFLYKSQKEIKYLQTKYHL